MTVPPVKPVFSLHIRGFMETAGIEPARRSARAFRGFAGVFLTARSLVRYLAGALPLSCVLSVSGRILAAQTPLWNAGLRLGRFGVEEQVGSSCSSRGWFGWQKRLPQRPCEHEWEYLPREPGETYTGYCERCVKCGEIVQIPQ